jgi:hypothetical protein
VRAREIGRVNTILGGVFLVSAVFYAWTAASSVPLSLHDGSGDRYNLLATALLHFHLYVGREPAALMHLTNPYSPAQNRNLLGAATDATSINDDVLYAGKLYFIWGAAPALVLLVPLHLLGFEPSASVTVAVYSIVGLGFALATLRVVLRQIGDEAPAWMCALAGLALSLCSAVPFVLRTPSVSEDILAGGYCFMMAGIWLAAQALVDRRASLPRMALMSLCFGLAAGSRPTLALGALVLIPVYLRLRGSRSSRSLVLGLGLPIAACFVLLLGYNQARFHQPFEDGSRYQLTGTDARDAPIGHLSYALPGTWPYLITLPQPMVVFPFIALRRPGTKSPGGLATSEVTGGLLSVAPIVVFLVALPWIWRRRPSLLGGLAAPLMILAGAGVAMMLLAAYEYFASTERYEVDFATLFILGGLAAWLSLSKGPPSRRRLLLRAGGGLLVAWGCAVGLASSFFGYGDLLAAEHPATWRTLEDIGSPLSTGIAAIVGHPLLAANFQSIDTGTREYLLAPEQQGAVTVVSPGTRTAALVATVEVRPGTRYRLGVDGPEGASASYTVPVAGATIEMPVRLSRGLNRLAFLPLAASANEAITEGPVIRVTDLSLRSRR